MKFWVLPLLVALFSGTPEGFQDHWEKRDEGPPGLHIGYRVVQKVYPLHSLNILIILHEQANQIIFFLKEEAERIYNNGWKAVPPDGTRGRQTGAGAYILRGFREWEDEIKDDSRYDCVATIDVADWNSWSKIWLPNYFEFPEDKEKDPKTCKPLELWGMKPDQSTC